MDLHPKLGALSDKELCCSAKTCDLTLRNPLNYVVLVSCVSA